MAKRRTAGELFFERYLKEHDYLEAIYEPDLGVSKRPDYYLVRHDGSECVCEIKEFSPDVSLPWMGGRRGGTTSMKKALQPIRDKIRSAAKQLKPLAGGDRALVVVLSNPYGVPISLNEDEMIWAMYGDPIYAFQVDPATGGQIGEARVATGRHGKLRNDHPYVSAVVRLSERERARDFYDDLPERDVDVPRETHLDAILEAQRSRRVPQGSYMRVDVYKTMSEQAIPLPASLFDGPNDRLFELDPAACPFVQVRGRLMR